MGHYLTSDSTEEAMKKVKALTNYKETKVRNNWNLSSAQYNTYRKTSKNHQAKPTILDNYQRETKMSKKFHWYLVFYNSPKNTVTTDVTKYGLGADLGRAVSKE